MKVCTQVSWKIGIQFCKVDNLIGRNKNVTEAYVGKDFAKLGIITTECFKN